jgi:uncharacterized protein
MKQIFINIVVADIIKSMDLYTAMGFTNNPQFSDDTAKCMVWSENIFVMLMTKEKFESFSTRPIANTQTHIAALYSLSTSSIDEMNSILEKGLEAGGKEPSPMMDYGFMQLRKLEDFDGHTWEIFFMDMSQFPS